MIDNRVYITCSWITAIAAVIVYCMVWVHFKGDDRIILANGATISDLIYFNSIKMSEFLGTLSLSFLCMFLHEKVSFRSLFYLKYFVYCICAILFCRMCFHFLFYNEIPPLELIVYGVVVISIILRAFYISTKNHGKHNIIGHGI